MEDFAFLNEAKKFQRPLNGKKELAQALTVIRQKELLSQLELKIGEEKSK